MKTIYSICDARSTLFVYQDTQYIIDFLLYPDIEVDKDAKVAVASQLNCTNN